MTPPTRKLSGTAFATLLLIALMMGANHVAARLAFNLSLIHISEPTRPY